MDDARPGQRRPTVGAALDVVAGGVRCRFRPPRRGFLVVFIPMAVFAGLLGSLAAIGLTFAVWAPTPTEADGIAIAQLATGERPNNVPGGALDCPETGCMETWDPAGDQVVVEDRPMYRSDGMDAVVIGYWPSAAEMPAWVANARARLVATGWAVRELDFAAPGELGFTADRADLRLRVSAEPWLRAPAPGEPLLFHTPASLTLTPHRPPRTAVSSAVGFVAGLLIGWLLTGWAARRGRARPGRRQTAVLLWTIATVLLAVLVDGAILSQSLWFTVVNQHPLMMLPTLLTSVLAIFVVPALLAAVAAFAVAAAPTRPRAPSGHPIIHSGRSIS